MLSKKYFALSAIILLVGCTQQKQPVSLLSKLEMKSKVDDVAVRRLASMEGDKCLPDIFTLDTLKEEIKVLEKKFESGKKVEGTWNHLDLSKMPIAQAQFLKRFGSKIGDRNNPDLFDYSSCETVPCVINKIYDDEKSLAGYVHYLWYLKMGNLLAPTNNVYNPRNQQPAGQYNGKTLSVSDYLYNDKEIFAIWRMLKLLKEPFTSLADLTEIYKVPRGHLFDFEEKKRQEGKGGLGTVCGEAWTSGYINMQDSCLTLSNNNMSGYFYQSFIHELGHQVDFDESKSQRVSRRSNMEDYLKVSGFYLVEYKNEAGETVKQWKLREGTLLPSSYGGTTPTENFAESLAQHRVSGESMLSRMSATHRNFIAENYYDKETYNNSALISKWIKQKQQFINQQAFQSVGNCLKDTAARASKHLNKSELRNWLTNNQVACLGDKFFEFEKEFVAELKVYDPDGCNVLTPFVQGDQLRPALKSVVIQAMNRYLDEVSKDSDYFKRIEDLLAQLDNRDIAREAYLSCFDPKDEKACYAENIINLYLKSLEGMNIPEDQMQEMANLYLENHEFSKTVAYAKDFYKDFARSHLSAIQFETEELFTQCLNGDINDDLPPVGTHISLGENYLVSSVFNCMNAAFPDSIKQLVRGVRVDGHEVRHAKEEEILSKEFGQLLVADVGRQYEENNKEEKTKISEFISSDKGQLRKSLLSDFAWVSDVVDNEKMLASCRREAVKKADIQVIYHLKSKELENLANEACYEIHNSSEYSKWLVESKDVFESKVKTSVDDKILDAAHKQAQVCIEKFPMSTNVERLKFKSQREACLLDSWIELENKVLEDTKKDPMVIKFKIDVESLRPKLESTRRRLQLKVIKENF